MIRTRFLITAALAAALLMIASTLALGAEFAQANTARAVNLSEANFAPDRLVYVKPGKSVTILDQCGPRTVANLGGFFTELSAYRWNGRALPAQRWNSDRTLLRWGRVSFDGITATNRYPFPVLFAGWCS